MKVLTILLFLLVSVTGFAQEKSADCDDAKTQMEMTACALKQYQQADKKLNGLYQTLLRKLDLSQRELLLKARRSWIQLRDNHCDLKGAFYEGGSIQPVILYTCKTELTETRIQDLERILKETE